MNPLKKPLYPSFNLIFWIASFNELYFWFSGYIWTANLVLRTSKGYVETKAATELIEPEIKDETNVFWVIFLLTNLFVW